MRSRGEDKQYIDVYHRVRRYRSDYCAIVCDCGIYLRDVNSAALSIAGSEILLPFGKNATIWQPAGNLSEDGHYKEWEVPTREEHVAVADELRVFVESYVIPFLDSYWSADDIVRHYNSDPRLPGTEGWPLILAASQYLVGDYSECARIIYEKLGMNLGGRSRYSRAMLFAAELESTDNGARDFA